MQVDTPASNGKGPTLIRRTTSRNPKPARGGWNPAGLGGGWDDGGKGVRSGGRVERPAAGPARLGQEGADTVRPDRLVPEGTGIAVLEEAVVPVGRARC